LSETTFAIVFFCACVLFLSAVGYFAFGVLAKFYAFIKFAVRLCLQEPKFSLVMFAPAFILSLYIALVSQNLIFDFTWSASANVFGGPASVLLLDALLFAFSLIARLEERYFYVFSFQINATVSPAMTMLTIDISLIKMFRLGPEVSLKGSPTVSPTMVAL